MVKLLDSAVTETVQRAVGLRRRVSNLFSVRQTSDLI